MTWTYKKLKKTLLKKKCTQEDFPFGPDVAVFKVINKMFACTKFEETPLRVNLKCHPEEADVQRALFNAVLPGYHMNKEHWNTVILDGEIPEEIIFEMIDTSYELVAKGLKKVDKKKLV